MHPVIPPGVTSTIILVGVVCLPMLLFKPTRAIVLWVFKMAGIVLHWAWSFSMSVLHKSTLVVIGAHATLLRNFLPRNAVIPTVAKKSTKRT